MDSTASVSIPVKGTHRYHYLNLPGTLDQAKIGERNKVIPSMSNEVLSSLTRKYQYIGVVWYQKDVVIPIAWKGKKKVLDLERVLWQSTVFVDGHRIGSMNSLVGTHQYDLSAWLSPGKHVISVAIDNRNKYPLLNVTSDKYPDIVNQDLAHAYTNHTQVKWNGVLGKIELRAFAPNTPYHLQVYPSVALNTIKVTFCQKNATTSVTQYQILDQRGVVLVSKSAKPILLNDTTLSLEVPKPAGLSKWDEFNPALYSFVIKSGKSELKRRFGFRSIGNINGNLTLNNSRIFLRGNLECVIFPLTGCPPTTKREWKQLIMQAKSYGLNHLRFHSWCPPSAAFDAADELGFYFQVELPHWSLKVGQDVGTTTFLKNEGRKIITDYGNHPSFILMTLGNELEGDIELLNSMVEELKVEDNRHLYATTSFSFQKPMGTKPARNDDFFITQWTEKGWVRGQGIFNDKSPNFDTDYTAQCSHIQVPLISHEIGQYAVYPDIREIAKYKGTLLPLNFMAIKNDLKKKGLLSQAKSFTYASGKLAALLYKEEIERALKTPTFDGFQLLQLQDYPGQGTALVGLLNAFWESKGIISSKEFRQFNSELVPLLRFNKATYIDGEVFNARIEIANFYKNLGNQSVSWSIVTESGLVLKQQHINKVDLSLGNNLHIGNIVFPITANKAQKLTIRVNVKNTKYMNSWQIWVYPKKIQTESNQVVVTNSFAVAYEALAKGAKVLLSPSPNSLNGIEGRFVPVFWSPVHFPNQPATMGLLLNNKHPALRTFPTSSHTDWQWWDLCLHSKSMIIDSLDVKPIVQVIDNFVSNHHLSSVFETQIGKGKLIFSSMDLVSNLTDRPVAMQLRSSLLKYMESPQFHPRGSISISHLNALLLRDEQKNFSTKNIYDN